MIAALQDELHDISASMQVIKWFCVEFCKRGEVFVFADENEYSLRF